MSSRRDMFNKYYASDIFNQNPAFGNGDLNSRSRLNRSAYQNTKDDIFSYKRDPRYNRESTDNDQELKPYINRSVQKRQKNLDRMYGSDIFFEKGPRADERRSRKKQIITNKNASTFFDRMKNDEEYAKELKDYTDKHRSTKKNYEPTYYIKRITPQERYYTNFYENQSRYVLPGTTRNEQDKINYIKRKINLHNDERIFNDVGADQKRIAGPIREIRYLKRHPVTTYQKRPRRFLDVEEHPVNTCSINKQIQFESHIFNNLDNPYSKTQADIKEINDRIQRSRHKHYLINILGQPYTKTFNDTYDKTHQRNLYQNYSVNKEERLRPATMEWMHPEAEAMYGKEHTSFMLRKYGRRGPSALQLKLFQYADSDNRDTVSGMEKKPYRYKIPKKEEKINNETYEKIDKIVRNIPNLNQGQQLTLKMKTSVLDCNNDNEWDDKAKTFADHFRNGRYLRKKNQEVTGKIGHPDGYDRMNRTMTERPFRTERDREDDERERPDRSERFDRQDRNDRRDRKDRGDRKNKQDRFERLEKNTYDPRGRREKNDPGFHNYVITYSKKGQNFGKFDDFEIKNLFGRKGIHVYDIHYNPMKSGNYNTISFKVMGTDTNNYITKRVKMVQEDLKKQNYKISIEKGEDRNHKKNMRAFLNNSAEKRGVMMDDPYENRISTFRVMPKDYKNRKGFTREFVGIDYKYKKNHD